MPKSSKKDYQLEKLKYHYLRLLGLGISKDEILMYLESVSAE